MTSLACRVQYVDDTDPFEYSANVPEPQRSPPVHSFSLTLPLINQIAAVYRVLRAPHRVSPLPLSLRSCSILAYHAVPGSMA
ncbi:FH1/FH2 domain-containing protein 3 isoform X4 [Aphis craccivora]|uniref:FH1/FH2 domain-containing protein 3 isoform X4 n=1 Tax=Aphis craccivora TaxID=307492 RepID=A0A6G0ZNL6_APHCR|nr:FH1/FH2 domain-containing protein 3 isoform X4 [Aphis craccivora]